MVAIQFLIFDNYMKNTIYTAINLKRNAIDFSDQQLGEECSKEVAFNETQKITELRLRNNNLTARDLLPICKMNWNKLNLLYLTLNDIGNVGCKYISQMPLPCLTKLGLGENNIENAGIIHLCKGMWPSLQQIYLFDNKIGDGSLGLLNRANWPRIKQLLLQSNNIGQSQVFQLFLSSLSSLKSLRISPNNMDKYSLRIKIDNNQWLKKKFILKIQQIVVKN